MISKRINPRKDGKSSAITALKYGEGLTPDRDTGEMLDKSHRTRLGNFGLVDDGVYSDLSIEERSELIELAALEMQDVCDLNTRVGPDKKIAHFVVSFNQDRPGEAVLRDTEDSMLAAMKLDKNHFASFLHNDNGYWHLHIFASRIEKEKPHRGNSLWQDFTARDKVCKEVEIRHNLDRDNGMHKVNEQGQIIEIPREERRAIRDAKPAGISDRAKTTEIYSGEKSFQTWCNEIRIGDRLKHAKNWQDLHAAAAAYGCEVKPKGAGFIICPTGQQGGIQLSKVGLKNLPSKFGVFESAKAGHQAHPETTYTPSSTNTKAASHYDQWRKARDAFKPIKTDQINAQREAHKQIRTSLRTQHKAELEKIRADKKGQERFAAVSIAKMEHTVALAALADQLAHDRQVLRKQLAGEGPGNTFRDYLVKEAAKGDNIALGLARKHGVDESTDVSRKREADQLKIVAVITGKEYRPAFRLNFTHHIERNGSVVFNLGQGRSITDSAIAKQVQLNAAAANSPEAIATALSFATTRFGNTLTLTGSQEFQRLAVETAVLKGLGIKFADPALEAYREKFAAEQKRESFIQPQEKLNASRHKNKHARQIPPTNLRDRLRNLSPGDLVLDTERDVGALRSNVYDRVEQQQEGSDHGMRRTTGGVAGKGTGRATDDGISPSGAARTTSFASSDIHSAGIDNIVRSRRAGGSNANQEKRIDVPVITSSNQPAEQEHAKHAVEPVGDSIAARKEKEMAKTLKERLEWLKQNDLIFEAEQRLVMERRIQNSNAVITTEQPQIAAASAAEKPAVAEQHQAKNEVVPVMPTAQEQLRAMVLSINPDAKFETPDTSDKRRLYSGPVVAALDSSNSDLGFAQKVGRDMYALHRARAPEHHNNENIDIQYRAGQAVVTLSDHEKGKGRAG